MGERDDVVRAMRARAKKVMERWFGALWRLVGARSERRSRASRGMAQGLVVALLTLVFLSGTGLVRGWGNRTLDLWFSLRDLVPHDEDAEPRVSILAIDAPTRRAWQGRNFDARDVGKALLLLKKQGVISVAVAVPDVGRGFVSAADAKTWQQNVAQSGIAHLPLQNGLLRNGDLRNIDALLRGRSSSFEDDNPSWYKQAAIRGHMAFLVDSDAHVRRVPLFLESDGVLYPSLALSTALQGLALAPSQLAPQGDNGKTASWGRARHLLMGAHDVALQPNGTALLNFWVAPGVRDASNGTFNGTPNGNGENTRPWRKKTADAKATSSTRTAENGGSSNAVSGNPVSGNTLSSDAIADDTATNAAGDASESFADAPVVPVFPTVSLIDALRQPLLLRDWKRRCVVIGVTDAQAAPQWTLASGARASEATIHAIALDNLLAANTLESVPPLRLWILTLFLCITVGGLVAARPPLWSGLVTVLALLAVTLLSLGLFIQSQWLDISLPCLAAALTFLQGVVARARLQERETTRVSSTVEALERAGAIIAARGQSQELTERVLQWTLAAMGADAALALVLENEPGQNSANDAINDVAANDNTGDDENFQPQFRVLASVQRRPRSLDVLPPEARDEIAARVTLQNQPMLIQDAHRDPRFRYGRSYYTHFRPLSSPGALSITSVIAAPLREGDPTAADPQSGVRTVGAILVINRRDGTPFHARDLELLTAVTNQASVALDNARLYEILNQRVERSESDLERTNRRLEAEKNTLQTVLESMTDGVVVTNNDGLVQILNPAARALLPELSDNVLGQPLALCLPAVADALSAHCLRPLFSQAPFSPRAASTNAASTNAASKENGALQKESSTQFSLNTENGESASTTNAFVSTNAFAASDETASEPSDFAAPPLLFSSISTLELQRGDVDAPRVIAVRSAPLLSTDTKDAGIVWVFSDVTEEKSIEQAKSDFVSFVAHEMRSPLTSISGFSLMLQRMEKPIRKTDESSTRNDFVPTENLSREQEKKEKMLATRRKFLGVIYNESERLTRLINNLLDVARLEAGRDLGLQREPLDFTAVANEAIESQRVYSSRHVLVNAVPDSLPLLFADRDKVLQILINLLSNAMKYSPGGNVTVEAHVEGEMLVASVGDEGPGIAPEHRARLFERFGRIGARGVEARNPGAGERAKPTGTGLGLFLTRHLVESHGGRIWLDDTAENGARFCFSLPLLREETENATSSTRSELLS